MAAVKVTKPIEEVDGDDAMPEWKRLSIERSLQGPRARAQERTDRFVGAAMELMGRERQHRFHGARRRRPFQDVDPDVLQLLRQQG